jgi:beta-barrel assembly-enhancing protease
MRGIRFPGRQGYGGRQSVKARLIMAGLMVGLTFFVYLGRSSTNEITGETQRVGMNISEEISLGLHTAPQMIRQHQGVSGSEEDNARVEAIGRKLLEGLNSELSRQGRKNPYPFEFTLLSDAQTINAFALPGGQVFITEALYQQLSSEDQVAGVIGHEIGHVLARHGAQQMAKGELTTGLASAVGVAAGDVEVGRMARMASQLLNMRYGREHELQSDEWGVKLMMMAGYDPEAMIGVMKVLEQASAGGPPEFFSTHPKPANRVAYLREIIDRAKSRVVPEN